MIMIMNRHFPYRVINAAFLPDVFAPLHNNHLRNWTTLHSSTTSHGILAPGISSSVRKTFSFGES